MSLSRNRLNFLSSYRPEQRVTMTQLVNDNAAAYRRIITTVPLVQSNNISSNSGFDRIPRTTLLRQETEDMRNVIMNREINRGISKVNRRIDRESAKKRPRISDNERERIRREVEEERRRNISREVEEERRRNVSRMRDLENTYRLTQTLRPIIFKSNYVVSIFSDLIGDDYLTTSDEFEECPLCFDSSYLRMLDHDPRHRVCISCRNKIDICPFCRVNLN